MKKWDIYLAYVRYEDIPGGKKRPVLVVDDDNTAYPISCLKMTGQPRRDGEYTLIKWREAGLHKETTVRIGKRLNVLEADFIAKIGSLDPVDILKIEEMLP